MRPLPHPLSAALRALREASERAEELGIRTSLPRIGSDGGVLELYGFAGVPIAVARVETAGPPGRAELVITVEVRVVATIAHAFGQARRAAEALAPLEQVAATYETVLFSVDDPA